MKRVVGILLCAAAMGPWPALAAAAEPAAPAASTLDQLLDRVRRGWDAERAENRRREAKFRQEKENQKRLLEEARATLAEEEARSEALEKQFQDNEARLAQLQATLRERLGTLGEAFGVVRQVAGDTLAHVQGSLVSAQIPGREPFLSKLAQSKALPSIEALERLWFTLQQEMTESGKVVRFPANVVTVKGGEVQREVIRVGAFDVVSEGKYLQWLPDVGKLAELGRQPASRYLRAVENFEGAKSGLVPLGIDPSRGAILSLLMQAPNARERVEQGGPIGYATIVLGVLAGLLGLVRIVYMFGVTRRVAAQRRSDTISENNPLGRVLAVHEKNPTADAETLELKLDEAILRESAKLERFLWVIKIVSVVAPLMGLLGTVTGMIKTFQVLVLFGTSDPKLMAGGIAEALVTTMIGLFVAIPLVLIHALVSSGSKKVIEVLEEQSAGLIAVRAEEKSDVAA